MGASKRIFDRIVPEWQAQFLAKSKDYNDSGQIEPADVLGVPGQFAEVWRKVWKLKKAMWDGELLTHEQPREILLDLIGHCFLAIDMLDRKGSNPSRRMDEKVLPLNESDWMKEPSSCSGACTPKRHMFVEECRYRLATLGERGKSVE